MWTVSLFVGVALVAGAIASPITIKARATTCPDHQDVDEFFEVDDRREVKWDYVRSYADVAAALENDKTMFVVDVSYDEVKEKNVISDDLTLEEFLNDLLESVSEGGKKQGVKYNVKSKEAFENFKYKNDAETPQNRGARLDLPPFPQWFHLNVAQSNGQNDGSVITYDDISTLYEDGKDLFNCYTFSFGWGSNDDCVSGNVDDVIAEAEHFDMARKTLVIDIANNPVLTQSQKDQFETFTFVMNEKNLKCASLKTFADDLQKIEDAYTGKLFMDDTLKPSYFDVHAKLCKQIEAFLPKFTTREDFAEVTWKSISIPAHLNPAIPEDVIKVDIDKSTPDTMFLGGNFKDFIKKLEEKNEGKPLQLNFKNQDAINAYWNIEHPNPETIKKIPISIGVDTNQLNYLNNKWMDCYTLAFSVGSGNVNAYTDTEIDKFKNAAIEAKSEEAIFALDLVKASKTDKAKIESLISAGNRGLILSSDQTSITEITKVRDFLVDNMKKTFIDAKAEVIEKINGVKMVDIFPEIGTDLKLLEFVKVSNEAELTTALKTPKRMIEVDIANTNLITTYFAKMGLLNDNGIKLYFSTKKIFQDSLPLLKYRNFPIWIQLDVNKITLSEIESELNSLRQHVVLGTKSTIDVTKMKAARDAIETVDVTISLKAGEYNTNKVEIDKLVKTNDNLLIWMKAADTVIAKDLRKNLKGKNYYLDVPNRIIMQECASNQKMPDFSKIKISKYVEKAEDVETYLATYNMIRAKIVTNANKVYVHNTKFLLEDFLTAFESHAAAEGNGIIFTFGTTDVFSKAMVDQLKTFNYPIWLDVNVYKTGSTDIVVDLKHNENNDIIDCRTLTLGLEIVDPFTKYVKADIDNLKKINIAEEFVYTIRADVIETSWTEVNKLIDGADNKNKIISLLPENKAVGFISKNYRDFIKNKPQIVSEFPENDEKVLECPDQHDVESFFAIQNDLSAMLTSGYVEDEADLLKKIGEPFHMIRAKVEKDQAGALYVGVPTLTLPMFLEALKTQTAELKKGIIFTFASEDIFDSAMIAQMKTLNFPIWFEFEAVDATTADPPPADRVFKPNYDKNNDILDCRTMLLTTKIGDTFEKYEQSHITKLEEASTAIHGLANKFSFRAEYFIDSWDILKLLLDAKKIFVFMPEDSDVPFVTKTFREQLKNSKQKMFVDLQGSKRHAMDECPKNDFIEYFSNVAGLKKDLTLLRISDAVSTIEAADAAIKSKKDVISVNVKLNKDNVPIIGDSVKLVDLLKAIEQKPAATKVGAKITFTTEKAFNAVFDDATLLDLLRNMERPIWINALVIGADDKILKFNYMKHNDLLDCRTLSLGWAGDKMDKYTETSVKAMSELPLGDNPKIYVVELLHLSHIWDLVKKLVTGDGNKNLLMLVSVASEADQVHKDYKGMEKILSENKDILLYDFPDVVRNTLNGSAGLSSNLLLASLLAFIVLIFH